MKNRYSNFIFKDNYKLLNHLFLLLAEDFPVFLDLPAFPFFDFFFGFLFFIY